MKDLGASPALMGLSGLVEPGSLLEATPECLVMTAGDGRIVFANRRLEELTGFGRDELVGRPVEVLIPVDGLLEPDPVRFETVCKRYDGSEVPVEVHVGSIDRPERLLVVTLRDVSDVHRGREATFEAEAKYRSLVEQIPAVVYLDPVDEDSDSIYVSPQITTLIGVSQEEWLTDPYCWRSHVHRDDIDRVWAEYKHAYNNHIALNREYRMIHEDGTEKWVLEQAFPVNDEQGNPWLIQGILFDITERKRSEERLQRRDEILQAATFAAGRFMEGVSWEVAIDEVLQRIGEAAAVSRAYVFQNERGDDGSLRMTQLCEWAAPGIWSTMEDPANNRFPYANGFERWERELGIGNAIYGTRSEVPDAERADMEEEEILSIAAVPVFVGGVWWGFVGFDDCLTAREWSQAELDGLRVAADTLGAAIGRQRALGAMQEAERRYRTLVEQVPAIVYVDVCDEALTTSYVSPQIRELLGVEPIEYEQNPNLWYEMLHPDDRERALAEYLEGRENGQPFSYEYRMYSRRGELRWFRDSAVVLPGTDGGPALIQGMMLDITERRKAEEQVAYLAYHDKLTGLPNRVFFEEMLELALARARRHDLGVGVLYLDLDNFKLVNDSLGHAAGDVLLVQLAERLRGCTRETDLVARQGGDEFLLLLSDLERGSGALPGTDAAMIVAESVAERVHDALRNPFDLGGTQFYASASVGISLFPQDAHDHESLLKNADTAMYQSKRREPGGYVIYASSTEDPLERLSLTTRLRKAVEDQNWVLHYQPVINLSDGSVRGVEALIRWQEANGGLIAPGEFIPLAEEMGLIEAIGEWVLDELAAQDRLWREQGLDLEMSFNLSPRQLWSANLAERMQAKLSAGGIDPHNVVVEITESTAMADPDRTQRVLSELHAWGLTLAIDDFGTGYSSLARLKHMPVDILKIDRSFVRDVQHDRGLAGMVRAMIQLAQSLGMTPLAEGIETPGEYEFLRANGCILAQGFLFSRPVPADEIPELARREGGLIPITATLS